VEAARSGSRPTVSLFGSYGMRADGAGDQEDIGSAGILVAIPVFDGGQVEAKVATEQAVLAASRDRLRKLELQIRTEIETALLDIRSSHERIKAARQSLEQADESLRIERLKYRLSSGSMLEVLDAQTALLQSETNRTRAQVDYHIAMARLKLATGENVQ
jgi:outer membrane protein TolC